MTWYGGWYGPSGGVPLGDVPTLAGPLLLTLLYSTFKEGNTNPALVAELSDANGAVPLDGASAITLVLRGASSLVVAVPMILVDGTNRVFCTIPTTTVAGRYRVEVAVKWGDGTVSTFPSSTYESIDILKELDNG